jgi:hypothetical protein
MIDFEQDRLDSSAAFGTTRLPTHLSPTYVLAFPSFSVSRTDLTTAFRREDGGFNSKQPRPPSTPASRTAAGSSTQQNLTSQKPHFANHLDFQLQLEAWFEKANARIHMTLRARPIDRLTEERQVMRDLPEREPDVDRRWVTRVPPDPHVRVDTNDYSLDPRLVGRRVEVRASQRQITAVALDTGELASSHERSFAKNRTITGLEHARLRERHDDAESEDETLVEQRPLAVYDG